MDMDHHNTTTGEETKRKAEEQLEPDIEQVDLTRNPTTPEGQPPNEEEEAAAAAAGTTTAAKAKAKSAARVSPY